MSGNFLEPIFVFDTLIHQKKYFNGEPVFYFYEYGLIELLYFYHILPGIKCCPEGIESYKWSENTTQGGSGRAIWCALIVAAILDLTNLCYACQTDGWMRPCI